MPTKPTPPSTPSSRPQPATSRPQPAPSRLQPAPSRPQAASELVRVGDEYAELFNASSFEDIDRLIADACVDPFWDDRTNLLSLLADGPEDLGLVLAADRDDYVVVRFVGDARVGDINGRWIVDCAPVDWEALEDEAFDDDPDGYPGRDPDSDLDSSDR